MISQEHLNPRLLAAQYAVRGPIVQAAQELEAKGRRIIYCNIGNPQALKQRPLTFMRQFFSLVEYPALLEKAEHLYPKDIVKRARDFLASTPSGTGAYTQSAGLPFVRRAVAEFISRRDGIPADPARVILTDGASKGAQAVLMALLKTSLDGFMIPVPQYPLYSASLELYGGRQIGYLLNEGQEWQLDEDVLETSLKTASSNGVRAVGIVVINPGNPTGSVLSSDNIRMIIGFAKRHGLAIIADEVYQENVYARDCRFHSFARVLHELKETEVPLFSLHSVSKGFLGECGHRGGYLELRNVPDEVLDQFIKLQSISLCSNVPGQLATYLMVAPPSPGDQSYETYIAERDGILSGLAEKARILGLGINAIPGMSVEVPQGAMYAFVKMDLPWPTSVDPGSLTQSERDAFRARQENDYCLRLLHETGICVVPGSGFGQAPGTLHFRTTFLPPAQEIMDLVELLKSFHERYVSTLTKQPQ